MSNNVDIPVAKDKPLFTPGPLTMSMNVKQAMLRDLGSGDFRVNSASLLIDVGIDALDDRNGPGPGLFNGVAPDIGHWESPAGY